MTSTDAKKDISLVAKERAALFCKMIESDNSNLKESLEFIIKKAMSDAVVAAKQDLIRAAFDNNLETPELVELVNAAIPTFGPEQDELSSTIFKSS